MKQEILQALKQAQGPVSGESLSERLGVSRTAVWKAIGALREEGYEISSRTRLGYQLVSVPDVLTAEEIAPLLTTVSLGRTIYAYETVDSTNPQAKRLAEQGAKDGSLIIAEEQLSGRGRLGRAWTSPPKSGVWMSLLLRPKAEVADLVLITLLCGLAVCEALREVTGVQAGIKWPNDVVVDGKKICGILTEMSAEAEQITALIPGIGINVGHREFPPELADKATSLYLATGKQWRRAEIAAAVLNHLEPLLLTFLQNGMNEELMDRYRARCVTLNREVLVISRDREMTGRAIDVTPEGKLVVIRPDGERKELFSGEVSVRGMLGYQ